MQERDNILKGRLPAVVAAIVVDYLTIFMRPFRDSRCLMCPAKVSEYDKLCEEHRHICLLCCDIGHIADSSNPVCKACEDKYLCSRWLKYAMIHYECIYQECYYGDDYPIDVEYLKNGLLTLRSVRKANKQKIQAAEEEFENLGGMDEFYRRSNDPGFWNTQLCIALRHKEVTPFEYPWAVVSRLIRKLT